MKAVSSNDIEYPYRNTSLVDLKDEIWKDIPGFTDYYQISNYGRVKRLERDVEVATTKYSYVRRFEEKILKGKIGKQKNVNTNEYIYWVGHTLAINGMPHHLSTARTVFYLFGQSFDLDDKTTIISFKDWDGRNIHISNLYKTSISDKLDQSYELDRSGKPQVRRRVSQYDANGRLIRKFKSATEAARNNDYLEGRIIQAASLNDKILTYKGFFGRFNSDEQQLHVGSIKGKKKKAGELTNNHVANGIKKLQHEKIVLTNASISLSLKSLKGETWKSLPGEIDGEVKISSYGRVKRGHYLGYHWASEKILSWQVSVDYLTNNVRPPKVGVHTRKKGVVNIPIARWVYRLFVDESFDVTNKKARIGFKDGNKLNLDYRNLCVRHFRKQ